MIKLDINQLDIIAKERYDKETIDRIYVVKKSPDGKYDDPLTCCVELDAGQVFEPTPYHQFWKFSYPTDIAITEEEKDIIKRRFHNFSISAQKRLISLYDPKVVNHAEEIVGKEVYKYVKSRMLLPLSDEEFLHIEEGFKLRWNFSTGKMVGDGDFKLAVGQYLVSIDYHMDLKKMRQVVDLILEYLEWIGQWGYNGKY